MLDTFRFAELDAREVFDMEYQDYLDSVDSFDNWVDDLDGVDDDSLEG